MTFVRQLIFKGEIDRSAFKKAVQIVIERHPLFGALIDSVKARRPNWVEGKGVPLSIDWGTEEQPIDFPDGEFIDLAKESGLRVWVRQGSKKAVVTLQIHHACTDGVGSMQAIGDLLKAYAGYQDRNGSVPLAPLRPELMKHRLRASLGTEGPNRKKSKFLKTLNYYCKIFGRGPGELTLPHSRVGKKVFENRYPRLAFYTFSQDESQALKRTSKINRVSMNDLFLRDLFLAIRQWNRQTVLNNSGCRLSVLMPINLRNKALMSLPATNLISYGFVTVREEECLPTKKFLEKVHKEADFLKNTKGGREFINKLAFVLSIPGLYRFTKYLNSFKVTAVLSNLGDITSLINQGLPLKDGYIEAGNLILEKVLGCPPLRKGTHAAIHIMTYAGRVTIDATCAPKLFSIEDTERFLSMFISKLKDSVEGAGKANPSSPSWNN